MNSQIIKMWVWVPFMLCALTGTGVQAMTANVVLWRGETTAEIIPGCIELGARPDGLTVRAGSLKSVKYAPHSMSLQRLEVLDRVVWDGGKGPERVIEISAPAEANPGEYVWGDVKITVLDQVLPAPKDWQFHLDLWQHPWAVARLAGVKPFSQEHYAAMRPVYELLATAGQKTITIPIVELPWNHQCYDAYYSLVDDEDFRTFDEYVAFCDSCGLGPDISCYSLCPWKLKVQPGMPEFESYWTPFMERFVKHLKEKGWYGRVVMSMDEREPRQVKAVVDFVHKVAPGMRISMAGNRKPSEFKGIEIDCYSQFLQYVDDAFLAETAERRAKGFVTTHYVCCGPQYPNTFMSSGPGEAFWLGAFPGVSGLDGFLRWAWNSWPQDPCADASFSQWSAGDTFLCYPGGEPSWRFLDLRNGIVASEKLRLLREKGLLKDEIAALKACYNVSKATSGKSNYVAIRRDTLKVVNSPALGATRR